MKKENKQSHKDSTKIKTNIGRCLIEIPIEEIDNLIKVLNKIKDGNTL